MEDERTRKIIGILNKEFPSARTELKHSSPFELLISTVLSAQCTDERVNKVTSCLFKKYKAPEEYLEADIKELENDIRSTGFYRNKTKSIRGICEKIIKDYNGSVPGEMEELLKLPGVARKTANVVLGNAFGKITGIVVDTHVSRVSNRLGLTRNENPEKIERDLIKIFPEDSWIDISHQMILLGRYICKARKPLCERCPLNNFCPSAKLLVKK